MEELLNNIQYSWTNFFLLTAAVLASYFVLRFFQKVLNNTNFLGRFQRRARKLVYGLLLIYEPAGLLFLGGVFVLVNPVFHGLLLLLLSLAAFPYAKNYVSGRIIQFDYAITVGNRLATNTLEGIIAETGRFGLRLRNSQGLHYVNYSSLLTNGYSLLSAVEIGGFYWLRVCPIDKEAKTDHTIRLMDLLATTPYLDWNHRPEMTKEGESECYSVKVLVKEESHLVDLLSLIREWGYDCNTFESSNKSRYGNPKFL